MTEHMLLKDLDPDGNKVALEALSGVLGSRRLLLRVPAVLRFPRGVQMVSLNKTYSYVLKYQAVKLFGKLIHL